MVSPAPSLDPGLMQVAGLDPERVRAAWRNERKKPVSNDSRPVALGATRHCALPGDEPAAVAKGDDSSAAPAPSFSLLSFEAPFKITAALFGQKVAQTARAGEGDALSQLSVLTMSQGFPTDNSRNLWTLVTAPDSASLKAGVDCLTHPRIWTSISGRLSVLQADETIRSVHAARDLSMAHWRRYGLQTTPKVFACPKPTLDQEKALNLCFDVVAPQAADLIILLERHGMREAKRMAPSSDKVHRPIIALSPDHADLCDTVFEITSEMSWREIASLVRGYRTSSGAVPKVDGERALLDDDSKVSPTHESDDDIAR